MGAYNPLKNKKTQTEHLLTHSKAVLNGGFAYAADHGKGGFGVWFHPRGVSLRPGHAR
jgi:hypothetical protein